MKINTKIMLLMGICLFVLSSTIGLVTVWQLRNQGRNAVRQIEALGHQMMKETEAKGHEEIQAYRDVLIAEKKQFMKSEVQTALSGLTKFLADLESLQTEGLRGETDEALKKAMEEEAKAKAADLIKHMRYGPENKDYFWINDMTPIMIMHPYKPQLNGKDLSNIKDPTGKKLFLEFVRVCKEKGEGFVHYQWPKYGSKEPQPKLSFVKLFKKWNWIIGTGTYTDDIEKAVKARKAIVQKRLEGQKKKIQASVNDTWSRVNAQIRRTLWIIAAVCLAILMMMLAVAYVFSTRSISRPITSIIESLKEGARQVASAASQLSASSQTLSEGASEQAASLEETSSSLEEMASVTRQNADGAAQANNLMQETSTVVRDANLSMNKLTAAMEAITNSSEQTSRIIKTIDEIAFQTNLLALNAAVEAARAGEAGAGFAVVADEVRNLAMRAAEAAKDTSTLIEENLNKIKEGTDFVAEANNAFSKVTESSNKVAQVLAEISEASKEQAQGIEQISKAVAQMDNVVQQNAANAEESASASEQLNAQVRELNAVVQRLMALSGVSDDIPSAGDGQPDYKQDDKTTPSSPRQIAIGREDPKNMIPLDDQDFEEF